ncbi:MAG: 50S ribosomal protein L7/L12 [Candidatus Hydrogenedentes bacterium]|nr:50S ribosomal protein L7/L12 [Candidatus Hydrogenedentota bacterium]
MSEKLQSIIDAIAQLNVLELSELVKALEEKFGVTASAPMAMAMPMMMPGAGAGAGTEAKEEGPVAFKVILKEQGQQKINLIKKVKDLLGLGLKEAKDLVDAVPKVIKENVNEQEAKKLKEELESVGAVVEIQGM